MTNHSRKSHLLTDSIGTVLIVAYKESTDLLQATFIREGFLCDVVRQDDRPEYQHYASAHRCMLNHQRAWERAAQSTKPTFIVEADFVPVVGIGQLPIPFNLDQVNVGISWLYTCAPQLYSVTPEGFGEGFSSALVAYIVRPEVAKSLCEGLVETITAKHGTGYHTFDSEIDEYLRHQGFKNYIPFRNYGEHGGKSNPEHRRSGMSGVHHADVLYGKLAFLPPLVESEPLPRLKLFQVRLSARAKGLARLLLGKYLRLPVLRRSSVPLRLISFALRRHIAL
jgi:hypothetical protein